MNVQDIPFNEIYADPDFNCRGSIAPADVIDLAKNIENHGLLQPINIQPYTGKPGFKYRIITGHRRHRALQILKRAVVPCIINEDLDEIKARIINLDENIKRQDLNLLQEAKAIVPLRMAGLTLQDIAKRLGVSSGWVQVRDSLLRLPEEIQAEAEAGFLTQEQVKDLVPMPREDQFAAVKQIKESRLRGDKRAIKVKSKTKPSPFKKKDRLKPDRIIMLDHMLDTIGPCLGTRILAWTNGDISDAELYTDLQKYASEHGMKYEIPKEVLSLMSA